MRTLKDAGFKGTKVATGNGMRLALGTLADGRLILAAKTARGEGYTEYNTAGEALLAFDRIMLSAGLTAL